MLAALSAPAASSPGSYLDKLNPEQRLAVVHGTGAEAKEGGPLLIIAGAGSGKTHTLAHRVAHLIAEGADPRRILLLTFSRRAASEMTRRVERIVASVAQLRGGQAKAALAWSGTFHSIGARLLREHAEQIGLNPAFTIHDREDSADLMNLVRHELGLSLKEKRFPTKSTCLSIYSRVINTQSDLREVVTRQYPWCADWEEDLRKLFGGYVEAKQRQNVLDYDDLLLYWAQMASEPALAAQMGERFSHILVDEYQDTNRLQASILMGLAPTGQGLTVVGDDAQSIYAFRGATVRNILDYPRQFQPEARVVTLERNYRSTTAILAASNAVIGLAVERFTKNLWSQRESSDLPKLVTVRDETDQAGYVVEQILAAREAGAPLKSQAVLFRASHHSASIEVELARRNIPFVKFGGLKFLDAAHVKDLLAFLRWVQNPRDRVAGFRVVQLLPGFGPKTAGRLLDEIAAASEPLVALLGFAVPAATREAWPLFVQTVQQLRAKSLGWPAELETVRQWYQPHLERLHEDHEARAADLDQLERIAAVFSSRENFITELTLDPPDATSDESGVPLRDEDYVILSTIHSAKGQEWRSVYLLNMVDGCLPSDLATGTSEEIEEERRLLYVAMTRAKDQLHVMVPQRFYVQQQSTHGDRHVYASRTRFIPADLLPHFESRTWPVVATSSGVASPASQARVDIAAKLRGMWG